MNEPQERDTAGEKANVGGEEPKWRHFRYRGYFVDISKKPERDWCEVSFRDIVEDAPASILSLDEWEQFAQSYIDTALSNPNVDEEAIKEELIRLSKYPGKCSRTGQAFQKGTMVLRGPKGWEMAEGWTADMWTDSTAPPNICFGYLNSMSGRSGLMLSGRVAQPLWEFISRYFEHHSLRKSDYDDEDSGGYWYLRDMWDLRLVETILGVPPENRYGIRPGTNTASTENAGEAV